MTKSATTKGGKKGKPVKKSAADKALEKLKSDHSSAIRSIFRSTGFHRVTGVSDKGFIFDGQEADVDDIYIFENIIVLAEYTCSQTSGVGDHLKKKKIIFDKILSQPVAFIDFLKTKFPNSADQITTSYHNSKLILKLIYCSRNDFDAHYKTNVPGPVYMDYPAVRYFAAVSGAIKASARFELLHFLGITASSVGTIGKIQVSATSREYRGSILPEAHSNFDDGYKVVTFYADPEALLKTAYVLRKDGWRDSLNLYQRMISKTKIESIRNYLKSQKRVFVNNIIVTMPPDVKPMNDSLETIDALTLTETAPILLKLPDRPNSIGIIDGQHRVFAYHETLNDDPDIAKLRIQQNLLVTGIIYPEGLSVAEREKFEARLFLEINSTQTNAKSQLKQAIGLVLDPFSNESVAARILNNLANTGPLAGFIEQYFFDTNKLKTSSIISFGLKPLVKASGNDSLFSIWTADGKQGVAEGTSDAALDAYVEFCTATINRLLVAIRQNLPPERWTTSRKVNKRVLATTYVNSFLITLRILIARGASLSDENLKSRFSGIEKFDFSAYHSSQYARMAEKIVDTYFGDA